ncbi:hypothetical protein SPRG_15675 [Saprolegnia parasitica CBS 223.65]|uniref:N-acetyltransferase domain-containing protein n=1 Tax=Saprolegnia parasitica (strain CBS 223.65) TaxID=695850 RepID=A0A067BHM4_SAPPC|nr:hypothetical protein SPRG_15675 [Saprolegnia parasitica CBS 223.65]KDO17899.1 hypothetical protein SPRG_15675 [Saprolegnia parasitica CBS 223.65]|eukprot:XP_012211396.1 hypothetical protein SPRG_15675 [Saprolegnia parasitica CBS 223.65]
MELRKGSAAQGHQVSVLTYPEWGAPTVSFEEYREREVQFRASEFGQTLVTDYVLVPTTDHSTLDLRGYLEVFAQRCILWPPTALAPICVDAFSVASLFTPENHRRKGYGAITLQAFLARQRSDYIVSNLYSDIGTKLYLANGWSPHPSDEIVLPADFDVSLVPVAASAPVVLTVIDSMDVLTAIAARDQADMQADLQPGQVGFLLTAEYIAYFHAKYKYFATHRLGLADLPTSYGLCVRDLATNELRGYVLYAYNFEDDQLDVLKYRALGADVFDLSSVGLWPTSAMELPFEIAKRRTPRSDSLSMLLVEAAAGRAPVTGLEWVANEKYLYA